MSLGYQVTSIVAGSLAPIIAVRLREIYKSSVPISWYLATTAAVSAVAALAARETKGIDLAAVDVADAQALQRHPTAPAPRPDGPEPTELVEGAVWPRPSPEQRKDRFTQVSAVPWRRLRGRSQHVC